MLSKHQRKFAEYVGCLLRHIYDTPGWGVTFGEAYRTPEQAAIYAREGKGITDSLHCSRLAIDLNFFINNAWQSDTEAYKPLGDFWRSLDPNCRWGGDFKTRKDGNHFEYRIPPNPAKTRQI